MGVEGKRFRPTVRAFNSDDFLLYGLYEIHHMILCLLIFSYESFFLLFYTLPFWLYFLVINPEISLHLAFLFLVLVIICNHSMEYMLVVFCREDMLHDSFHVNCSTNLVYV